MSENKHYGRQIFLSLFLTVFLLLGILYLASRYLLPLYDVNQQQLYGLLVKLFPLLIGLVMIEIGVMIARRRDEDYADQVDKLPPNAYDKPFHTLPHDDPSHIHSDQMLYTQAPAMQTKAPQAVVIEEAKEEGIEPVEIKSVAEMMSQQAKPAFLEPRAEPQEMAVVQEKAEQVVAAAATEQQFFKTDFDSILTAELENSMDMDYDLTLVMIEVSDGPASLIANKLMMLSGELAYSFTLEGGRIAMVLPFYNGDEARSFTLTMIESCKREFSGSSLQIGFASRNGRMIEGKKLLHEAQTACESGEED